MYRFSLIEGSAKYKCPNCSQETYKRYVDNSSGEILPYEIGRCNREDSCGYHKAPREYFDDNPEIAEKFDNNYDPEKLAAYREEIERIENLSPSFIELETYSKFNDNSDYFKPFLKNYLGCFDKEVEETFNKYVVGGWRTNTLFPYVDNTYKIRSAKVIKYNENLHRDKSITVGWLHKILRINDFNFKMCLFGEHLLDGNDKKIKIVESEKTAIIMDILTENKYLWLATGGLSNINLRMIKLLSDRNLTFIPDLGIGKLTPIQKWQNKINEFTMDYNIELNYKFDIKFGENANDIQIKNGWDIADYILEEFNFNK